MVRASTTGLNGTQPKIDVRDLVATHIAQSVR